MTQHGYEWFMGAVSQETQLQTIDQYMVNAEADHDTADVATHILTKMVNTLNVNILSRDTSMKTMERFWILCKSKKVSNAK